jgi:DnaA-like protein
MMRTSRTIPVDREKINDKTIPPSLLVSWLRLLTNAWDGAEGRAVELDFDTQIIPILGVSRSQAREHMRLLRYGKHINWTTNGAGRYRITFPGLAESGKPDSEVRKSGKPDSIERESGFPDLESESVNYINSDSNTLWPKNEKELRAAYALVLSAGHVFPSIRQRLAAEMAAEGDGYLPHLLGQLALIKSGWHEGYEKPAVYFKDQAQDRAQVLASDLPPAGISFQDAMRWAMNGGKTDAEIAEAERTRKLGEAEVRLARERVDADDARAQAESAKRHAILEANIHPSVDTPVGSAGITPRTIWQATLDALKLETPKSTYDTWICGAVVMGYEHGLFVIGVDNNNQVNWLNNRMLGAIKRVLGGLAGMSVEVAFVAARERLWEGETR